MTVRRLDTKRVVSAGLSSIPLSYSTADEAECTKIKKSNSSGAGTQQVPTLKLLTALEAISTAPCTMVDRACTIAAACCRFSMAAATTGA